MPIERPFKLISAALRLADALDDLTEANEALDLTRDRLNKLERQTTDLFESVLGDKGARANSLLQSTRHRFRNLRNTLLRSQRACDRARNTFETRIGRFEDTLEKHNRLQAAGALEAVTRHRTGAAFQRALRGLIQLRLTEQADQMTLGNFVLPEESHSYIAYSLEGFVEALMRVDELLTDDPAYHSQTDPYRPVSFLEVGCGHGRNLMVAKLSEILHCHRYAGFDLNFEHIEMGQKALGLGDEIFVADALDFDYGPYDVLFSYRPIRDPALQARLERRMAETMRPGAYLIAPLAEDLARYPALRLIHGALHIWRNQPEPA